MSRISKLFQNVRYPIIQAPMTGGNTTAMAIAACNSGIIGSLCDGTATADTITTHISDIRSGLTDINSPFNVNIFVTDFDALPDPTTGVTKQNIDLTIEFLNQYIVDNNLTAIYPDLTVGDVGDAPYYGLPDPSTQIQAILDAKPPIVSSTFGTFTQNQVKTFQEAGIMVLGTATNVEEALDLSNLGVDGIVLQCGHRLGWTNDLDGYYYDLNTLLNDVDNILPNNNIPRIACGGIMTSSDINSLISRNDVQGVQLGNVSLNTEEIYSVEIGKMGERTSVGDNWENAIRNQQLDLTGKWEVPIINNVYKALENFRITTQQTHADYEIPDWPFMNNITLPFQLTSDINLMSIHCGKNTSQITQYDLNTSVSDLIDDLGSKLDSKTLSNKCNGRRTANKKQILLLIVLFLLQIYFYQFSVLARVVYSESKEVSHMQEQHITNLLGGMLKTPQFTYRGG